MVDGARVKSDGVCSIEDDFGKEHGIICFLELVLSLLTFAKRLTGHSGLDAKCRDSLDGLRIGPQPEARSPIVLSVVGDMLVAMLATIGVVVLLHCDVFARSS
jgi:hypothetical protein